MNRDVIAAIGHAVSALALVFVIMQVRRLACCSVPGLDIWNLAGE